MAIVQTTSEVNPVDAFVESKISFTLLLYKLICGAIVTVVAFRLNDVLKNIIQGIAELLELDEFANSNKTQKSVIDLSVVLIFVVMFAVFFRFTSAKKND